MKRRKMSPKESRSNFRRGAVNVKSQNMRGNPLRGGIRL